MKEEMIYRFRSLRNIPTYGLRKECMDLKCTIQREYNDFREIDAIRNNYIWFASPSSLNDCHEFKVKLIHSTSEVDQNELLELCKILSSKTDGSETTAESIKDLFDNGCLAPPIEWIENLTPRIFSSSFSKHTEGEDSDKSPLFSSLMWGHYGGALNGIAMGFESDTLLSELKSSVTHIGKVDVDYVEGTQHTRKSLFEGLYLVFIKVVWP